MTLNNFELPLTGKIVIILNLLGLIYALTINVLSNALPLNGKTAGQISDSLYNYFAPAGYVFLIWFFIYIGWIALVYFTALTDQVWFLQRINIWLFLNLLLNGTWLIFWHYGQYLLSVLTMIGIFLTLVIVYLRVDIGRKNYSKTEILYIKIPISLYFGWITTALIANITAYLVSLNVSFGDLDSIITVIVMFVAMVITLLMLYDRKDIFFALVSIWALIGIYIKQSSNVSGFMTSMTVAYSALVFAIIIIALTVYTTYIYSLKDKSSN